MTNDNAPTSIQACAELDQPRANDWQAWIYPRAAPLAPPAADIFASSSIIRKARAVAPNAKPLPLGETTFKHFTSHLPWLSQCPGSTIQSPRDGQNLPTL